jgi:hypothetical protein
MQTETSRPDHFTSEERVFGTLDKKQSQSTRCGEEQYTLLLPGG